MLLVSTLRSSPPYSSSSFDAPQAGLTARDVLRPDASCAAWLPGAVKPLAPLGASPKGAEPRTGRPFASEHGERG